MNKMGMSMKRYLEAFHPHLYKQSAYLTLSGFPNLDTMAPHAVATLIARSIHYPLNNFDRNPLLTLENMEAHAARMKQEYEKSNTTECPDYSSAIHPEPESGA